jgi:hypothetical protein
MTNLPSKTLEAEALTYARSIICHFRDSDNPWSEHSLLSAEAGTAFTRRMIWSSLLHTAKTRLHVLRLAREGDRDAQEMIGTLLLELDSRNVDAPAELRAYRMELLEAGRPPPLRRGQKKQSNLMRDICVCMAVAAVVDRFGLAPTTRAPDRLCSACGVVAQAMQEAQLTRGYKAIEAVWLTYGHAMPTVPGWSAGWPS